MTRSGPSSGFPSKPSSAARKNLTKTMGRSMDLILGGRTKGSRSKRRSRSPNDPGERHATAAESRQLHAPETKRSQGDKQQGLSKTYIAPTKPPEPLPVTYFPAASPPHISWQKMLASMRSEGWKYTSAPQGTEHFAHMWIHPSATSMSKREILRICKEGVHYFTDEKDVKRYAAIYLGWRGEGITPANLSLLKTGGERVKNAPSSNPSLLTKEQKAASHLPSDIRSDSTNKNDPSNPPAIHVAAKHPPGLKAPKHPTPTHKKAAGKKDESSAFFTDEKIDYLKAWLLSKEHIMRPYPSDSDYAQLSAVTMIDTGSLAKWFV